MRGQASLEFIIIFAAGVMAMATFFIIGAAQMHGAAGERNLNELNDIALSLQQEMVTALSVHDGYERTFSIPYTIANEPYQVQIVNDTAVAVITLQWKGLQQSIRAPQCTGTLLLGPNTITKENGTVHCNP